LVKFNAFVKEKQLKVERGNKSEKEERNLRNQMTLSIQQKEQTLVELTQARVSSILFSNIYNFVSAMSTFENANAPI